MATDQYGIKLLPMVAGFLIGITVWISLRFVREACQSKAESPHESKGGGRGLALPRKVFLPAVGLTAVVALFASESLGNYIAVLFGRPALPGHDVLLTPISQAAPASNPAETPIGLCDKPFKSSSRCSEASSTADSVRVQLPDNGLPASSNSAVGNTGLLTLHLRRQSLAFSDEISYKSAYWGKIRVGQPRQTFKVVIDTGSGHLILPTMFCHSKTCKAHKRYRRSSSKTAKDIDEDGSLVGPNDARDEIHLNFGTGEVTGVFIEEEVCLEANVSAQDHDICTRLRWVAATDMSEEPFKAFRFDGILGLGLAPLSQTPEFNLVEVLAGAGRPRMFSVFLGEDSEESEISFGGYRPHRTRGLSWNKVIEPELGHWMLAIKSIDIDGAPIKFCREGCKAVADSGTSVISVPTQAFPEMFELLRFPADPAHGCRSEGPTLNIMLESVNLTLHPKDYAQLQSGQKSKKKKFGFDMLSDPVGEAEHCRPLLMAADVLPKLFVLGEPILRKYYTVFDAEGAPRIAFGRAIHAADGKDSGMA
eukprot:CAMPEP_0172690308 /NCGR_PEP_ID=MMETSP1074-20121228/23761_1 /TAXON_ID=2916 /ORGANISM="Ceratium fusus, Strain PA161109" /LENGTH=534 /DNA_ID=CAMNT_0013510235 /DNA_START=108 /DNA_END=1709 /DNA_ORIENTATION=+